MPLQWIALNSVKGLGPVRIKKLLEKYETPGEVFRQDPSRLVQEGFIPQVCAAQLSDAGLFREAQRQLELAARSDISIMTLNDSDYPPYLNEIYAPPPVLYIKGNRSVFKKHAISVVGTRHPTSYGKQAAVSITTGLVEHNLAIVSGLALGIDTIAHETTIKNNGFTVAVLGSGIDKIYPRDNQVLAEKISQKGILVSEFPLGTAPEAFNFPRRNRIISGLSAAVLVVEAPERSGSLITAHYALQQGRDIFAVPGPITSPLSAGTFNLLKDGAIPARSGKEIAECLNVVTHSLINVASCPAPVLPLVLLSDSEKQILEQLSDIPVRIDDIAEKYSGSIGEVLGILLNLELKGLIHQISGQQFVKIE